MKSTYKHILELLNISIHNQALDYNENNYADLNLEEVYKLAKAHNILPLIYEGINNINDFDKNNDLVKLWKNQAISIEINQVQKSLEFLNVYNTLVKSGITPIVVKGITCRELYPIPDSRPSSDEDILIKEEEFELCDKILKSNGMRSIDNCSFKDKDVISYFNSNSRLMLEVHKTLFNKNEEEHVNLFNEFYKNCFEEKMELNIQGQKVYTFPHTMNLLYLITHTAKHFLHGGVGIRQICDIVKFIEVYHKEIDWADLWSKLQVIKYDYFVFALLNIGELYLGLGETWIDYPKWYNKSTIDSSYLLEDILDAGIFGGSTMERKQSSLMTLGAVNNSEVSNSKLSFISALFPSASRLEGRYTYLKKMPILLPIAWGNRLATYIKDKKHNGQVRDSVFQSVTIGNQRIELLKKYKII